MSCMNIVLIGMPNAGKSSCGKVICNNLKKVFIDTDSLITLKTGKKPPEIVNEQGLEAFLLIQEEVILSINARDAVISTGGAVIYSVPAMNYLKSVGKVFFLEQDVEILKERIINERRFATSKGKSFEELYKERMPIYKEFADEIIDCRGKEIEDIATEIINKIYL